MLHPSECLRSSGHSSARSSSGSKIILEGRSIMTKSKKLLIASAAVAGLLAGTGAAIQASNLLPGMHAATAQDTAAPADKKVKEKHACKGQNSCTGNGGCETDGSKMPTA